MDWRDLLRRPDASAFSAGRRSPATPAAQQEQPPAPANRPGVVFDLPGAVKAGLESFGEIPLVNLADALSKLPFGLGVWGRLLNDKLTNEDEALLTQTLGGMTSELRDDVVKQLTRSYSDTPTLRGPAGAAVAAAPSVTGGAARGAAAVGSFFGVTPSAAPPSATGTPPSPVSTAGMGTGPEGPLLTEQPFLGGAAPGGLRVLKGADGSSILVRGDTNQPFGWLDPVTQQWKLKASPTAETLSLAANSGYFDAGYLQSLQTTNNSLVQYGLDAAYNEEERKYTLATKKLELQVLQGDLTVAQATKEARVAYQNSLTRKAEIDAEAAAVDLLLAPLTKQEKELAIRKAELDLAQAEQTFPLDLQLKREQVANAQFTRQQAERAASQTEANNVFARDTYGSLLNMISPGGETIAGSQAAADAAAMSATPSSGGPPPIFGQLAEGAGTTASDPAAQAAFQVMMDQLAASGGGQPAGAPAPAAAPPGGATPPAPAPGAVPPATATPIALPTPEEVQQEQA